MKKLAYCRHRRRADVGHRACRHDAEAGRGDHQPGAHRDAEVDRRQVRGRQSRHQGRDHLAALGPGVREIRDHGVGRRHCPTWSRCPTPGCRSTPTTACSKASSPISPNGSTPAGLNDRALELGRDVKNTAYMLPYGFYLRAMFYNKKLFQEAGVAEPPKTHGRVRGRRRRRSPRCPASTAIACAAAPAA